jgi:MFS family permease
MRSPATFLPGWAKAGRSGAFRSRDYRLFLLGNLISWVGDWMDLAALNWAVLERTGSAIDLGLINACRLAPVFLLSLPAGVLADRVDRRRLLIGLQSGTMALTFLVGLLLATRAPFPIFALAVAARAGLAAMVLPIRNALLPALVPSVALPGAVAGQAAAMNLARIIGPALAAGLLLVARVETVFWINGASFAAVLGTLIAVDVGGGAVRREANGPKSGVREAIAYIRGDGAIRSLLTLAIVPMVFGFPYTTLIPLFARDLLHVGPSGFGALLSASAAGALIGSGWLTPPGRAPRSLRSLVGSTIAFGLGLLLFTASRTLLAAAGAMFFVGLAGQVYRTSSRILLQDRVPDHLRGRILSIALMDRGFIPLGAIVLGAVGDLGGAAWAGVVMGGGCVAAPLAVLAARRQAWRP